MLQKIVIDKVIQLVAKKFKIRKILDYVEKPNELDVKVDSIETTLLQHGRLIEFLIKDSHPKRDFVECEKCKKPIKEKE